jgi:hypothetical protein
MNFHPLKILREAIRAVPAVKYALGVAGVVSAIAIIRASGMSLPVALFGFIIMLALMIGLLVFAKMTAAPRRVFLAPILVMMWSLLVLMIMMAFSLFLSVFFRWPVDLQGWISPAALPARFRVGDGLSVAAEGGTNVLSLYATPTITLFSNDKGNQETGSTVTQTALTWVIGSGTVTTQWISHGIGSLPSGQRSVTDNASYSTDQTWTLFVNDGRSNTTDTTSVLFLRKRYWGASAKASLNDAQIIELSSELATNFSQIRKLSLSAEHIYFAWPSVFGTASFIVDGFVDDGWELTTRNFTNASGHPEGYHIYRHILPLTGKYYVETRQ